MFAFSTAAYEAPITLKGGFANQCVNRKGQTGYMVYNYNLVRIGFYRTIETAQRAVSR